jgi:hypothetical protein
MSIQFILKREEGQIESVFLLQRTKFGELDIFLFGISNRIYISRN